MKENIKIGYTKNGYKSGKNRIGFNTFVEDINKKKIEEERKKKRSDYKIKDSYQLEVNTDKFVNKDVSMVYSLLFSNQIILNIMICLYIIFIN